MLLITILYKILFNYTIPNLLQASTETWACASVVALYGQLRQEKEYIKYFPTAQGIQGFDAGSE